MQNYLWILNALTEHYGHLKQWGRHRNAKILFFFPNKAFGDPNFTDEVLRLVGREGRVLHHHPATTLLFQQFLIRMLGWTTTEPCHMPQRWHRCSVVHSVGHKCSPFLKEEALAPEHKPLSRAPVCMKLSGLVSFEGVFFAKPSVFSQEQGIIKYKG